jgi:hypothetical protein
MLDLDKDDEVEILRDALADAVKVGLRHGLRCTAELPDDELDQIAAFAVVGVIRRLRVMSGRQLGVVMEDRPNRHEGWVIHEPPQYVTEES